MRTREQVENSGEESAPLELILEVLLDIREMLEIEIIERNH